MVSRLALINDANVFRLGDLKIHIMTKLKN